MIEYKDLRIGSKVKLINQDGWGRLHVGVTYEVTDLWTIGINLDGIPVSMAFAEDFELVEA